MTELIEELRADPEVRRLLRDVRKVRSDNKNKLKRIARFLVSAPVELLPRPDHPGAYDALEAMERVRQINANLNTITTYKITVRVLQRELSRSLRQGKVYITCLPKLSKIKPVTRHADIVAETLAEAYDYKAKLTDIGSDLDERMWGLKATFEHSQFQLRLLMYAKDLHPNFYDNLARKHDRKKHR